MSISLLPLGLLLLLLPGAVVFWLHRMRLRLPTHVTGRFTQKQASRVIWLLHDYHDCHEVTATPADMYQRICQLLNEVDKRHQPWRLLDSKDKQLIASWTLVDYLEKTRPGVVEAACK